MSFPRPAAHSIASGRTAAGVQCAVAALRAASAALPPHERSAYPHLSRALYLADEGVSKLRLQEHLGGGGVGIQAAVDPRMAFTDEAAQFTPASIAPGAFRCLLGVAEVLSGPAVAHVLR